MGRSEIRALIDARSILVDLSVAVLLTSQAVRLGGLRPVATGIWVVASVMTSRAKADGIKADILWIVRR